MSVADTVIYVGPTEKAIGAARSAILDILASGQEQKTLRAALDAFTQVTKVENTTISGNTFEVTR